MALRFNNIRNGNCIPCGSGEWSPLESTICSGVPFQQSYFISGCSSKIKTSSRSGIGIKCCPQWSGTWVPSTTGICSGTIFNQTLSLVDLRGCISGILSGSGILSSMLSGAGVLSTTRIATGTKLPEWGALTEWSPNTNEVCSGVSFQQTRHQNNQNNCGPSQETETRTATGTKEPNWSYSQWNPPCEEVCDGVSFTQTRTLTDLNNCQPDKQEEQMAYGCNAQITYPVKVYRTGGAANRTSPTNRQIFAGCTPVLVGTLNGPGETITVTYPVTPPSDWTPTFSSVEAQAVDSCGLGIRVYSNNSVGDAQASLVINDSVLTLNAPFMGGDLRPTGRNWCNNPM